MGIATHSVQQPDFYQYIIADEHLRAKFDAINMLWLKGYNETQGKLLRSFY